MKFICQGVYLSNAATVVGKACAVRTTTPVLECIRVKAHNDTVTLTAYDGELSIEKNIRAEILEEGEICVNGRLFSDFLAKVSDKDLVICVDENGMEIRYEDSNSFLQTNSAADFPDIKNQPGKEYFELKESDFKTLISKVTFCCATDESRPILKGCLLEAENGRIRATALDGFRLAVSECNTAQETGAVKIVCPARTLTEIARMLEGSDETLRLCVERNMLMVTVQDTTLTSRLYTGEFVRKENIYPASFATKIFVSRSEITESFERAAVLTRGDRNNLVFMDIRAGGITLAANSEIGKVSETVNARVEGPDLRIAMNGKYALDALKALDEEKIILSFNSPIMPFTLENEENKDNLYLILPVRTSA